jgi:hypothetical protein
MKIKLFTILLIFTILFVSVPAARAADPPVAQFYGYVFGAPNGADVTAIPWPNPEQRAWNTYVYPCSMIMRLWDNCKFPLAYNINVDSIPRGTWIFFYVNNKPVGRAIFRDGLIQQINFWVH